MEFLQGLAASTNLPFVTPAWADEPWNYTIRHRARWLNVYVTFTLPTIPSPFTEYKVFLKYDGATVGTFDLVLKTSPTYLSVDLDAAPGPYTSGNWFSIQIDVEHAEWGADAVQVLRVFESDTNLSV